MGVEKGSGEKVGHVGGVNETEISGVFLCRKVGRQPALGVGGGGAPAFAVSGRVT